MVSRDLVSMSSHVARRVYLELGLASHRYHLGLEGYRSRALVSRPGLGKHGQTSPCILFAFVLYSRKTKKGCKNGLNLESCAGRVDQRGLWVPAFAGRVRDPALFCVRMRGGCGLNFLRGGSGLHLVRSRAVWEILCAGDWVLSLSTWT